MQDLLAFGRVDLLGLSAHLYSFRFVMSLFLGVDHFVGFNVTFRKKLLRSLAGLSATPVVHPFQLLHSRFRLQISDIQGVHLL